MEAKTRKKLEALLWKNTHKDFRGSIDGEKNVLINRGGEGTCLVPLSALTDEELLGKLPKRLMVLKEEDRTRAGVLTRRWAIEGVEYTETSSRLY
jgi:hypothetical protein